MPPEDDRPVDTTKVNRFEVIDPKWGRVLVRYDVSVDLAVQDGGRTLKVFIKEKP